MKFYLEAFVDTNFGDNLFLYILTSRYKEHDFYMWVKKEYEESYLLIEEKIPNLHLVYKMGREFFKEMRGMFIVGGDMFADGADFSQLITQVRKIKRSGGFVAFLGNSLFQKYSRETCADLTVLFSSADLVVLRDQDSYQQLKKMVPSVRIQSLADMVFSLNLQEYGEKAPEEGLLGISVRQKNKKEDVHYQSYCDGMASVIEEYLRKSEKNRVVFLSFSCGLFDDRKTAKDIAKRCEEQYRERISETAFDGDIPLFIEEIKRCENLICTRFHSLVFALLLKKGFVPIIYEDKMERLLDEIGYEGIRPKYEEHLEEKRILSGITTNSYSEKKMNRYLEKAEHFFDYADVCVQNTDLFSKEPNKIGKELDYYRYFLKPRIWGRKIFRHMKYAFKRKY